MDSYWDQSVYCSPIAEPISLECLVPSSTDEDDEGAPFDIADPAQNPEAHCQLRDMGDALAAFVASLRPREQELVHRLFWLGETQSDVGRAWGVSRMAVSKAMKRISQIGRVKLADLHDCAQH
jgi:DNA-directed RNA polymerase specialized sigma subunit